jgi:hypothetical protein
MIVSHLLEVAIILTLRLLLARDNKSWYRIQGISGKESVDEKRERERERDATAFSNMTDRENLNFRCIY